MTKNNLSCMNVNGIRIPTVGMVWNTLLMSNRHNVWDLIIRGVEKWKRKENTNAGDKKATHSSESINLKPFEAHTHSIRATIFSLFSFRSKSINVGRYGFNNLVYALHHVCHHDFDVYYIYILTTVVNIYIHTHRIWRHSMSPSFQLQNFIYHLSSKPQNFSSHGRIWQRAFGCCRCVRCFFKNITHSTKHHIETDDECYHRFCDD